MSYDWISKQTNRQTEITTIYEDICKGRGFKNQMKLF